MPTTSETRLAAIDITTGYGVDSWLESWKRKDPWYRKCFSTLVDLTVNASEVFYPLPRPMTGLASPPESIRSFKESGLLHPYVGAAASSVKLKGDDLTKEFNEFARWIKTKGNDRLLRKWIYLHSYNRIRKPAGDRLEDDVQPFVRNFWSSIRIDDLAERAGIPDTKLRFTFDTLYRTNQYYAVLSQANIRYFPHPLRRLWKAADEQNQQILELRWSWGEYLARAIDEGLLRHRTAASVAEKVARLREVVANRRLTWHHFDPSKDHHWQKKVIAAAVDAKLPARLLNRPKAVAEGAIGGLGHVSALLNYPVASVFLIAFALGLLTWDGSVVEGFTLRALKGVLEWPGLFSPEAENVYKI